MALGDRGVLRLHRVQVWLTSRDHTARPVQAIVVMGAAQYDGMPSPTSWLGSRRRARLWGTASRHHHGGHGLERDGDQFTEAHVSAVRLEQHGVPAADVVEVGGDDSWTNLSLAAAALTSGG